MKFYEKITLLRKQKGLTQEALAFKLGISRQAISKWETGECEPDMSKLKELAKLFDVSIDYLLFDDYEDKIDSNETNYINKIVINKNYWPIVVITSIIVLIAMVLIGIFVEFDLNTNHSGFIGFLESWNLEAIMIKVVMLIALVLLGFSIYKIINIASKHNLNKL